MPKLVVKRNIVSILCILAAVLCLAVAGVLLFNRFKATTGKAEPPKPGQTITEDVTSPSEVKLSQKDRDSYNVPADQPRSISLPDIGASGLVQRVGLTKQNAVATPASIYFAGWYINSVLPGEAGLSIIDGHVSGTYNDGIFKRLKDLKRGQTVIVEFGDKSTRTFEVVSVTTLPESKTAAALFARQRGIAKQLNLVTCGGKFNRKTQSYADRVVVVTKLKK